MFSLVASVLAATSSNWSQPDFLFRFFLGLWILLYFSVPWLLMQNVRTSYSLPAFLVDCIDLLLLVSAVLHLGFVFNTVQPNLAVVYVCIAAIPVVAYIGNILSPRQNRSSRWHVSAATFLVGLAVPVFGLDQHVAVHAVLVVALYVVLGFYFYLVSRELKKPDA